MMYTDTKLKEYNEREERFRLAIEEATTNKAASINSIANKYKVSRTTLSRRIHGFKNTRNSHEKQQKFTNDEEMRIVGQINVMLRDQHHIPQKREILHICENLLKEKHKDGNGSENCKVGKNWIDRFLERHNDKLMIDSQTTLAEYYKNEFLERKKLRADRGYKSSIDSSSLTPTDDLNEIAPHASTSSASTMHSTMPHHQHHELPRLPYTQPGQTPQQPQQSDPYMYQEQVMINPFSMPTHQVQPQQPQQPSHTQYQDQWPQFSMKQMTQPQTHQSPYQPHQHLPQPSQQQPSQQPLPQPQQQQQQQQQQQSYSMPFKYNYNYQPFNYEPQRPIPASTSTSNPGQLGHHSSASQQLGNTTGSMLSMNTYGFGSTTQQHPTAAPVQSSSAPSSTSHPPLPPQQPTSSTTGPPPTGSQNAPTTGNEQPEDEMMHFFQNGRFQYDLARQRVMKELHGHGEVDVGSVSRVVGFVFDQIDRDLQAQHQGSTTSQQAQQTQQTQQQPPQQQQQQGFIGY